MDLQVHNEERDIRLQELLKDISTISTERVSQKIEGDYLTQWDEDSYHVVHYVDYRVEKTLVSKKRPSVMLKHVEKVFNDWDLPLNIDGMKSLRLKEKRSFSQRFIFGDSWITVYMNDIHQDMLSDDAFGRWYKYEDGMLEVEHQLVKLEEWIASVILKQAKKYPSDKQLQRSIKLKSLIR